MARSSSRPVEASDFLFGLFIGIVVGICLMGFVNIFL